MIVLRKYNTATAAATHVSLPLIKRGVVDYAVSADWTPAAGDVKLTKDGDYANTANITTLPTAKTHGNTALWEFQFSATELSCKKLEVTIADSATKAVEDQSFFIETYGNASAMYQADLSAANLPANVTQWLGTAAATPTVAGVPEVDVTHYLGSAAPALVGGRYDASVGAMAANVITAAAAAADFGSELQALITGGAYALSTDANGRMRIVDGTGVGELDTLSGTVLLRAATQASIDAIELDTNELQTDWANGGRLDNILDARMAKTDLIPISAAVNDAAATTTTFISNRTETSNAFFPDLQVKFTSGQNAGVSRVVLSYNGTTKAFTLSEALPFAPANGDTFDVISIHTDPASQIASTVWSNVTRTLTAGTNIQLPSNGLDNINVWTVALIGNITGSLSGSVGSMGAGGITAASFAANALTASAAAADLIAEIQAAITGGAYAISTDANGRVRIVDGTGVGELDTTSGAVSILASEIRAAVGLAAANLDTQLGDLPTAAENATALLDLANGIETGITPRQAIRAIAAKAAGLISGAGTGTETIKGIGQGSGGTTRLVATVDASGNITAWALSL